MGDLRGKLGAHDFRALFIELLGWDHVHGGAAVTVDGTSYRFEWVAEKRGFVAIICQTDRYTLFNRQRLRVLQRELVKIAHEHIVIYICDEIRKQVWQWAAHRPDGRRLRHREHPFFSSTPPEPLVQRLQGLRFTIEEEERLTIIECLARVRSALDTDSELAGC